MIYLKKFNNESDYLAYRDGNKYGKSNVSFSIDNKVVYYNYPEIDTNGFEFVNLKLPSSDQIKELIDNTTTTWTTSNGVSGVLFTSKKDNSKFIFIPVAGSAWRGSIHNRVVGYVWSSMLSSVDIHSGHNLYFYSGNIYLGDSDYRCNGFSVRGVIG